MKGEEVVPSTKLPKPSEKRIEYKRLDSDRVLVTAHRPGKKPLKTIIELFHAQELEEPSNAPAPQGK